MSSFSPDIYMVFGMDGRLVLVQMLNKGYDPAAVKKDLVFSGRFVCEANLQSSVKKCQFPQPLREHIPAELQDLKYLGVGLEGYLCASPFCLAY